MKRLFGVILVLFLAACASAPNYTGQWIGDVNDTLAGYGQGNLSINHSGNELSGTWQIGFASGINGGSLQGTVNGNAVSIQLYPSNPNACPFNVTASLSGNTMVGNYASFNCTGVISGTLSMSRQ